MAAAGVITLDSTDIKALTWKDFRDAVYKVPAEERKDCAWFLHETALNHIANIEGVYSGGSAEKEPEASLGV
jgi:HK97 family phage major capsid protein